tara:strand:+ start:2237 stop:3415 length:1179 start_codon:yes stop_codon:yes gene_type:complete
MHIAILAPISSEHVKKVFNLRKSLKFPKGHGYSIIPYIALGLIKLKCKITIISLSFDIKKNQSFKINKNLEIVFCPTRKHSFKIINFEFGRGLDFFKKEIQNLIKAVNLINPDIVNAHWTYEYAIAAIKSKTKHLITVRDISTKIIKIQFSLYKLVRLLMDFYVFLCGKNFLANSSYTKSNNLFSNKIKSIVYNCLPNYISKKKLKPKRKNNEIIIVSSGGFGKRKNIENAILAFNKIKFKNKSILLKLVGNDLGVNDLYHKDLIKKKIDLKRINFLGRLEHTETISEIKKSYILLHPSKEESFGNIYLEAMSCGTPIIAGKFSGATAEVIKSHGLLVDVNNINQIANAITRYFKHQTFYNSIRYSAYSYVFNNFNYMKISKQYLSIFRKIK